MASDNKIIVLKKRYNFRPACIRTTAGSVSITVQDEIDAAAKRFGLTTLYPVQRLIITQILEAARRKENTPQDAPRRYLSLLPTGAGKSLCFQLPAALLPQPSLIVFPLLSLMADQLRRLAELGLKAFVLRGGMSREAQEAVLAKLRGPVLLLANPEILLSVRIRRAIKDIAFSQMVVDEAHCVAEWGTQFRPSFLELGALFQEARMAVLSAFTATATVETVSVIHKHLFLSEDYSLLRGSPDRPNIHYSVVPTLSPSATLHAMLRRTHSRCRDSQDAVIPSEILRPCIVFADNRGLVARSAQMLRHRLKSREVFFYHAGLSRDEKTAVEEWFFKSRDGILVATCAYGMGVDKPDIRSVVHLSAPQSVAAYLQESGRAGRDREASAAFLLFSPTQKLKPAMAAYCTSQSCRRIQLLSHFGVVPEFCSGCDICDGRGEEAEGAREILECVVRYPRQFRSEQLVLLLSGIAEPDLAQRLRKSPQLQASLANWNPQEIEEAIACLESSGVIRRHGALRGRVLSPSREWRAELRSTASEAAAAKPAHARP